MKTLINNLKTTQKTGGGVIPDLIRDPGVGAPIASRLWSWIGRWAHHDVPLHLITGILLLLATTLFAVPNSITFQARLMDGNRLVNGLRTGGFSIWNELMSNVVYETSGGLPSIGSNAVNKKDFVSHLLH